jgi:hypothetical protein
MVLNVTEGEQQTSTAEGCSRLPFLGEKIQAVVLSPAGLRLLLNVSGGALGKAIIDGIQHSAAADMAFDAVCRQIPACV